MISETLYRRSTEDNPDAILDKPTRRKIFLSVSLAHIMLVVVPFLFFMIYEKFTFKKPAVMMVSLVNLAPPGPPSKSPGPDSPVKSPVKEDPKPVKAPDEPAMKQPDKPAPDEPIMKQPDKPAPDEPVMKPPSNKPEPAIKEPSVKTVPAPTDKPKPQDEKWKPLDPTKITISEKVVKGQKNPTPPRPAVSADNIADNLKKLQQQCKVTPSTGGGGAPGANTGNSTFSSQGALISNSYYDIVSAYLYKIWRQPLKSELGGVKPVVLVHITVDGAGKIRSAQISKNSGIAAMDRSVAEMLKKISNIPAPPGGSAIELDVSMEIVDE